MNTGCIFPLLTLDDCLHSLVLGGRGVDFLVLGNSDFQVGCQENFLFPLFSLCLLHPMSVCYFAYMCGCVGSLPVPADTQYSEINITSEETAICSEETCSSEVKNWCVIARGPHPGAATIKNISKSIIIVDEAAVEVEGTVDIKCGSKIMSGPNGEGHLVYTFKATSSQKQDTKGLMIPLDPENAKCSICLNIWHDVVTIAPCLHNFCNGCFSEWLRRSEKKYESVLCPQCRATVRYAGRNHFLHNIEEAILQKDSSLRRSNEELGLLDRYATIQSNLVLTSQKIPSRKRPPAFSSDEDYVNRVACPQCGTLLGGFRCNPATAHLQCEACRGLMPSRPDSGVPQYCLGCDKSFCGAYWQAQGFEIGGIYPICRPETFRPVSDWGISGIPDSAHENNRHEQDITERCIQLMGKTFQAVITEWIGKFESREIDRTRLQLNHVETITSRTHLCGDCYRKLVNFLLYWFRLSMPRYLLPPDASTREDCWYGYDCRTQHHNEEHARKRNHVCRPTRGNPGM